MASTWRATTQKNKYGSLRGSKKCDIVIIGGGITGIVCSYILSKSGYKVILLEKKELCGYATFDTTAFITKVLDTSLSQFVKTSGSTFAKLLWQSGDYAIGNIEKIINDEKIDCEFIRSPLFIYGNSKKMFDEIKDDARAYKKLRIASKIHNPSYLPFPNFGSLEIPDQAKFHPGKFLSALVLIAEKSGAEIFENSEVVSIEGDGPVIVRAQSGSVRAHAVVIATYRPFLQDKTRFKKGMYRSYVYELMIQKGSIDEAMYVDNENPYHYFRVDPQKDYDRVILGGEDHRNEIVAEQISFRALKKYADGIFSNYDYEITRKWSGPILEPSDGLALIGEIKPNYFVASAFSGNGMTYAMLSALIFNDMLMKKDNSYQRLFDPKRSLISIKTFTKARDYLGEFFGGIVRNLLSGD